MSAHRLARLPAASAAVAVFISLLALAAGCSDDDDDNPVVPIVPIYSSIVISGPDSVLIDQNVQFTATVLDTAGQPVANPQINWHSSATGIVTIASSGIARGVTEGDALITATGGGATSTSRVLSSFPGYGWINQTLFLLSIQNLNGVFTVDGREAWVVGDLGSIYHTPNAGLSWINQNSNSTAYTLNSVWFTNRDTGIVVGSAGRVLRTTNGGTLWRTVTVDSDNLKGMNKVFFQDENRGWIVGNGGLILRTNNGGASWTRVLPAVTQADLHDISFPRNPGLGSPPVDPYGHGWAVGNGGTIIQTNDFGQSWRIYTPFATTEHLRSVGTHDVDQAIAVGLNNRALFTSAVGDTFQWTLAPPPTPFVNFEDVEVPQLYINPTRSMNGTFGIPAITIWASGKRPDSGLPVILYSEDLGQSWTNQDLPSNAPLTGNGINDVFMFDQNRGWAVGTQGLVLHTVNGGR